MDFHHPFFSFSDFQLQLQLCLSQQAASH